MNAPRQVSPAKRVDLQAAKIDMRHMIQAFVGSRQPVSLRTIQKHFSATPALYVTDQVNVALEAGIISIRRNGLSRRAGYVYELTPC